MSGGVIARCSARLVLIHLAAACLLPLLVGGASCARPEDHAHRRELWDVPPGFWGRSESEVWRYILIRGGGLGSDRQRLVSPNPQAND